ELARAEDEITRRDLVAEGFADLADAERQFLTRGVQHVLEIDEDALGSFRTEIGDIRAFLSRTDKGLEHEVELLGCAKFAAAGRAFLFFKRIFPEPAVAFLALYQRIGKILQVAARFPGLRI